MGRKEIDRDKLRERVLDNAETLVRRRGLGQSTMSELVRTSGVSRRTFYKVFGSREQIVRGVIDRNVEWLTSHVRDIVDADLTTEDKLAAMLAMAQKVTAMIPPELLRELATAHPDVWEYIDRRRMAVLGIWKQLIVQGQRRGDVRRDIDPQFFMYLLTTVAQHMINPTFLSEHDMTISDSIRQMKEILLYGILPREGRNQGSAKESS